MPMTVRRKPCSKHVARDCTTGLWSLQKDSVICIRAKVDDGQHVFLGDELSKEQESMMLVFVEGLRRRAEWVDTRMSMQAVASRLFDDRALAFLIDGEAASTGCTSLQNGDVITPAPGRLETLLQAASGDCWFVQQSTPFGCIVKPST